MISWEDIEKKILLSLRGMFPSTSSDFFFPACAFVYVMAMHLLFSVSVMSLRHVLLFSCVDPFCVSYGLQVVLKS